MSPGLRGARGSSLREAESYGGVVHSSTWFSWVQICFFRHTCHLRYERFDHSDDQMSALTDAINRFCQRDLEVLFDDEVEASTIEVHRSIERLNAERLRLIGEVDRRQTYTVAGHPSTASWLAVTCRLAWGHARRLVGHARSLAHMPGTASAYAGGEVDTLAVRRLIEARNAHPVVYERDEKVLVDAAATLVPREFRTAVAYWRQNLDHRAAVDDANHLHDLRRLHLSQTFSGMGRIDGDLDPEGTAIVATALQSLTEPAGKNGDVRSPAQRRADALVDLCRAHLDHGDVSISGAEKPHLSVLVDLPTLIQQEGSISELDDGTVLHPETIRRFACDASVTRIVLAPDSQPLDIGRKTRVVPAGMRRALVARDRGCNQAGCDRPARWCDAHHIKHWADGSPTSLNNLRLLCRHHHRLVHEGDPAWAPP